MVRITDVSAMIAGVMGTLLVVTKDVLETINHFAPAIGAIVTVLALFANVYFQVARRESDKN